MIIVPPIPFLRRRRLSATQTPPPPAALVLVSAGYIFEYQFVELEFDREIDIDAIVGAAFQIFDGFFTETQYDASGAALVSPTRVRLSPLNILGEWVDPDVKLTASAMTGIRAVDDGGTWAGVTDLVLPYP